MFRRLIVVLVLAFGVTPLLRAQTANRSQAQARTAIQGTWSSAFTARDHPEWKIEDYFCPSCPPIARQHLRALLADPANDSRSLRELGREATRVANQHVTGLMTEAGRARREQNDPAANPEIRCEPPGLVRLLQATHPIALAVHDDHVVIHHDHWNTMRTIRLTDRSAAAVDGSTRLGSSTARFEGSTLVIESLNVAGSTLGTITTDGTRIVERWTASDDGARLNLELIIDDPASYREPLVLTQSRVRTPAEKMFDLPPCEAISGQP